MPLLTQTPSPPLSAFFWLVGRVSGLVGGGSAFGAVSRPLLRASLGSVALSRAAEAGGGGSRAEDADGTCGVGYVGLCP